MEETVLEKIVAKTRVELEIRKRKIPAALFNLEAKTRSLKESIEKAKRSKNALITEIKPASPSQGMLASGIDAAKAAKAMEKGGACALSVLTEPFYFQGSLENLMEAKVSTKIPVMRKDFIVDEYQLLEAKHYGADAVLLMVSVLGEDVGTFYDRAKKLGMECLVEIHDASEIDFALSTGSDLIGINNRNLRDLKVDLNTTKELSAKLPAGKLKVSESGVKSRVDLDFVLKYADAALVGSSLMTAPDLEKAVNELVEK